MKTFLFTLFTVLLFVSSPVLSQLNTSYPNAISNNVIVRMQQGENPEVFLKRLPAYIELEIDQLLSSHSDIWLLKFNNTQTNVGEVIQFLQKESSVLFVQPNRKVELRAAPNDPGYGSQWQHDKIDSELAWDITTGGTSENGHEIVIALIESADLINHPDLQDNHWKNTAEIPGNGIDDDGNGYIDDYNGWNTSTNNDNIGTGSHGTTCAGMIGAKGNNGIGVTGINWDVKIMNISGYNSPFTEANIIASYNYALNARLLWNQTNGEKGAFVVATSASWGVDGGNPNDFPIWCSFYDDLGQAGILNAGATTNNNSNVDVSGDVPTGCASDYMVGVTATNSSDNSTTGYGATTINVAAPGLGIYSTAANGGYTNTSGTSFACPLTAGLIGLMYSIPCNSLDVLALNDPQGTADLVRQALYDGVDLVPQLQTRTITGGRINAKNSIDLLMTNVCDMCVPPRDIHISNINEYDATVSFTTDNTVDSYIFSIRTAGSGGFTDYTGTSTNFTFTGLNSCTDYEYYVTTNCAGELSIPSSIQTFKTSGCGNCIDLPYCETKANNPGVDLMVNQPSSLQGSYPFTATNNFGSAVDDGYVYGELVLVNDGTTNPTSLGCSPLINAAALNGNIAVVLRGSCDFTTKVINAQNAGATAVIVINNVGSPTFVMGGTDSNITIPAIMISQADGTLLMNSINNNEQPSAILGQQNEWISSFTIGGNTITTGDDNGYRLHENPITLTRGQTHPFTLTPGYDGQPLEEYTRIWLDMNQDGVFDNTEVIYDQGTTTTTTLSDAFTIPMSAQLGSTRMRVQMVYQGQPNSTLPDVCGSYISGEVEDFCVNLTSGVLCNMTVNQTIFQPTCNEVKDGEISLNVSGGTPGYTYLWNNGSNNSNISNLGAANYSVIITDNTGCDTIIYYSLNYTTQLDIQEFIVQPSCNNLEDGSISVTVTGSNNISYNWINGPVTPSWTNLGSGNYSVIATDDKGCKISGTYNLIAPNIPIPTSDYTTDNYYLVVNFNNNSINANTYYWDFGDGNNSTDEHPSHTYSEKGSYIVCLTANGNCDTITNCKTVIVESNNVGLIDKNINSEISIYPNPAKKNIQILKNGISLEKVVIYNTNGQQVNTFSLTSNTTVISVENWIHGVYFFHVLNKKGELVTTQRVSVVP